MKMSTIDKSTEKEKLILLIKKGIELLCEKNISNVVILSSYKINSVLKDNYGVNIKVDRIGRVLSNIAKRNELKRLSTNIPKYKLQISMLPNLKYQ
jgi:hypothetical protein